MDLKSLYFICLLFFYCLCDDCKQKPNSVKLVIDNDAGGDDAIAIFLALEFEKFFDGPQLVGLTTVNGNTFEDNVKYNNQRILKIANRQDVPIYRGAKKSFIQSPEPGHFYGIDGLGDSNETLENLVEPNKKMAVDALIELSKMYEGNLIVVTLGTVTNVALAIMMDPNFLGRLKQLYLAAGHINSEKYPSPEFNVMADVEAYHIIAEAATPDKVTVFPFSQLKDFLSYDKTWRENIFGAIETDIIRHINIYEREGIKKNPTWQALDPATVAVALRNDLALETRYCKNDIILCGDKRGINTNEFVTKDKANMRMMFSVKKEEYAQFLMDVFTAELRNVTNSTEC